MSTTKSETGWSDSLPRINGWYWTRKSSLPRMDVLHVVRSQVAFGAMWLNPVKDPAFFENRVWLGPITPTDAEQLVRLRGTMKQIDTDTPLELLKAFRVHLNQRIVELEGVNPALETDARSIVDQWAKDNNVVRIGSYWQELERDIATALAARLREPAAPADAEQLEPRLVRRKERDENA